VEANGKYTYYPGCSQLATGKPYDDSIKAVFQSLGVPLPELSDWNCCGATSYMNVDEAKAFVLAARNLAIAERDSFETVVAPCPACYLVLSKTADYVSQYPELAEKVGNGLEAVGLSYQGKVDIRHPLDIVVNDIGLDKVIDLVKSPLDSLKVFPYYGCLMVRPYAKFDDMVRPTSMDRLLDALGAKVIDNPLKTKCCGGTMMETIPDIGMRLNQLILKEAKKRGADVIATACQFCQFNLECYQDSISSKYSEDLHLPIVYFSQLMGLAFGLAPGNLGLESSLADLSPVLKAAV
jgi:heterodisulfide reductase subunit B